MRVLVLAAAAWPSCQENDTILRGQGKYALFTDVTEHGKSSGCFMQKCQNTDKFRAASAGDCALTCRTVQGCHFWSFGEEAGEPKCWLRTSDAGREALAKSVSGSVDCAPPAWPQCVDDRTILRGQGKYAIFVDVTAHGKNTGCFQNNCKSTDKFDAADQSECASICYQVPECKFWAFGDEQGTKKCWLRSGDGGREPLDSAVAGSDQCAPPEVFLTGDASGLASMQGVWSMTYTNGHRDTYTIDSQGRARRAQGGVIGQLGPYGSAGDGKKDKNYAGKYFLTNVHRDTVWEYIWVSSDGQKLFLRHFCEDNACAETSPEGSGSYCCSATGDRVGTGPEKIEHAEL